jgi:hypothetical protein
MFNWIKKRRSPRVKSVTLKTMKSKNGRSMKSFKMNCFYLRRDEEIDH